MRIAGVPVLLWFTALLGLAMAVPALSGLVERDWRSARLFLFAGVFAVFASAVLGMAARRAAPPVRAGREELLTLVGVFALGPVFAGVPFWLMRPELGPFGGWFEALASLTTTGASLLPEAPPAVHLWRALLGWLGGLATLVAAAAVLAPRELIDLPGAAPAREAAARGGRALELGPGGWRVLRAIRAVGPVYAGFTAAATVALEAAGAPSRVALTTAMGLVSTSGIGPGTVELGFGAPGAGRAAEAVAALCLALAATRWHYGWRRGGAGAVLHAGAAQGLRRGRLETLRREPEFRLGLFALGVAALWLWLPGLPGGWEGSLGGAGAAAAALWGAGLTALSFLTTTGYVSADWPAALAWAGLAPGEAGLLLAGLATLGGGVATTVGGVKLYRAYALYRHGLAELARLTQPHVVDSTRTMGGDIQRRAIVNAWVAVMLHLAALAAGMLALGAAGLPFEVALTAAVAALSNVGPLLGVAAGAAWGELPAGALGWAAALMVLGRVELVAAVALLNPAWWGRR